MNETLESQNIAIILAGGTGSRAQTSIPKQFVSINGRPIIHYSIEAFCNSSFFKKILVVVPKNYCDEELREIHPDKRIIFTFGGDTRVESVGNALNFCRGIKGGYVFIHDAARPGIDQEIIDEIAAKLNDGYDGIIPTLPVSDALWRFVDDEFSSPVSRADLLRAQTPQAFNLTDYIKAFDGRNKNVDYLDDAQIAKDFGLRIGFVTGKQYLDKVTHLDDFKRIESLMHNNFVQSFPRIGSGYDAHRFTNGDFVTLCGVKIPHTHALAGHSDADVAWHALVDALLGAIGEGDIGRAFPPTDMKWKGAPSSIFLEFARDKIKEMGGVIGNIDLTLICEKPKITPHYIEMRELTAKTLQIDIQAVNIKATTTEKMGFTGREEGIAAMASAIVFLR